MGRSTPAGKCAWGFGGHRPVEREVVGEGGAGRNGVDTRAPRPGAPAGPLGRALADRCSLWLVASCRVSSAPGGAEESARLGGIHLRCPPARVLGSMGRPALLLEAAQHGGDRLGWALVNGAALRRPGYIARA